MNSDELHIITEHIVSEIKRLANGDKIDFIKGLAELKGEFRQFTEKVDTAFEYNREEHQDFAGKLDNISNGCGLAVSAKKDLNEHKKDTNRHIGILYRIFTGTIVVILLTIAGWIIKGK